MGATLVEIFVAAGTLLLVAGSTFLLVRLSTKAFRAEKEMHDLRTWLYRKLGG